MQCYAKAYQGQEPYACFIADRDDARIVYPLVERLASRGLRIWHDADVPASVWTKQIREHLQKSAVCIILLTSNSTSKHIFREHLTLAIEKQKSIVVIQCGNVLLSLGMRLQAERCIVQRCSGVPDDSLLSAVLQMPVLQPCMGAPNPQIVVQPYEMGETDSAQEQRSDYTEEEYNDPSEQTIRELSGYSMGQKQQMSIIKPEQGHQSVYETQIGDAQIPSDSQQRSTTMAESTDRESTELEQSLSLRTPSQISEVHEYVSPAPMTESVRRRRSQRMAESITIAQSAIRSKNDEGEIDTADHHVKETTDSSSSDALLQKGIDLEETVDSALVPNKKGIDLESTVDSSLDMMGDGALGMTVVPKRVQLPLIVSLSTGEYRRGCNGETTVGRKKNGQAGIADVAFDDECMLFSGMHFRLIETDGIINILALHSNGVSVDGYRDLQKNESVRIEKTAVVSVPKREILSYYDHPIKQTAFFVAFGEAVNGLYKAQILVELESVETGEIRCFYEGTFELGKKHSWRSGAMIAATISREHATLIIEGDHCFIQDHSHNGTYVNGIKIETGERHALTHGDRLSFEGNVAQNIKSENFIFRCFYLKRGL